MVARHRLALLAGLALAACDDGSLQVFEPEVPIIGGSAGGDSVAQAGAGRGSAGTPDSVAGRGGTAAATDAGGTTAAPDADGGGAAGAESTSLLLIDDFEDGDPRAKSPFGWWYPVNDKSSAQGFGVEPMSGDAVNVYALRTHGSGFRLWGSAVGVDLGGEAAPLDLSGYRQLCFRSRIEPGSSSALQVHFLRGSQHYTQEVTLSESWTRYCLNLSDFVGPPQVTFVPNEITALQFFFTPNDQFLIWLDDVEVARD